MYFDEEPGVITIKRFAEDTVETTDVPPEAGDHGGGDNRIMKAWVEALQANDPNHVLTEVHESLRTHRIVFAAEQSRREKRMVHLTQ